MSYDLDWLEDKKTEKESLQEAKKIEIKKIAPEPEKLDEIDLLTKGIELAPKKLTIAFEPIITIRKLMAVREMFNLKAPKKVNKEDLAELLIKALKTIKKKNIK